VWQLSLRYLVVRARSKTAICVDERIPMISLVMGSEGSIKKEVDERDFGDSARL